MLAWFVLTEFVPPVVTVGGVNVVAVLAAIGVGAALLFYPEWYVIDTTGVLMGAGAAALFGISFGLLPAILLLSVLAIYDAISVYGTEHMLDLAEGVMDLKIPVVFVVPTSLSYSYLAAGSTDDVLEDGSGEPVQDETIAATKDEPIAGTEDKTLSPIEDDTIAASSDEPTTPDDTEDEPAASDDTEDEPAASDDTEGGPTEAEPAEDLDRDALFIGLGDAVIPTVLVVSAAFFIEAGTIDVPIIALNLAALGAMVGTIAGLLVLMYMVLKGRPHAGLPLLNGGAIGGYLIGAVASGLSIVTALGL